MTRRLFVALSAILACLAAGCQSDPPRSGTGTVTGVPSPTASAPTANAKGTRAVAVYYAGDAGAGVRLYREFHSRPRVDTVIRDAVDAMANKAPSDSDYRSLWPATAQVHRASKAGDVATVDMEAGPSPSAGPARQLAVQQLVWTVTAADPTVTRVRILVQGKPLTASPVGRAASANTLGPVWLSTPANGASVSRTFTFSGEATVFEATVSWEVRQGTTVVKRGFVTATKGAPARGTWQVRVTVPAAGRYQLVAFESSAQDGKPVFADSKSVTVR